MEKLPLKPRKISPENKGESNTDLREKLHSFCVDNFENINDWLEDLEPEKKIKVLLDVCKFVLPTLQSINLEDKMEAKNRKYIDMIQDKIKSASDNNKEAM